MKKLVCRSVVLGFFSLCTIACQTETIASPALHCTSDSTPQGNQPTMLDYSLVAHYPHRIDAFSQGLIYSDNAIIESTGLYGRSSLAHIPLGATVPSYEIALDPAYFGEGLTRFGDQLLQLTWKSGTVLRYQFEQTSTTPETPVKIADGRIEGEGWGITSDGELLYTSNGSATLSVRDPQTLQPQRTIRVNIGGRPIRKLNELEWVNGCILANIWGSATIAVINPASGSVQHQIDLSEFARREHRRSPNNVANGIAYRHDNGNLLVTGKNWQYIYELQFAGQMQ